jgi:hypothetical protein
MGRKTVLSEGELRQQASWLKQIKGQKTYQGFAAHLSVLTGETISRDKAQNWTLGKTALPVHVRRALHNPAPATDDSAEEQKTLVLVKRLVQDLQARDFIEDEVLTIDTLVRPDLEKWLNSRLLTGEERRRLREYLARERTLTSSGGGPQADADQNKETDP